MAGLLGVYKGMGLFETEARANIDTITGGAHEEKSQTQFMFSLGEGP